MNKIFQIFLLFFYFGADCQIYNGNIYLSTQADVDSFPLRYPGIQRISGLLRIGIADSVLSSDIVDLTPIRAQGVHRVGSLQIVRNDSLATLAGLEKIDTSNNNLVIWRNARIKDLTGLSSIAFVYESFIVQENDSLKNLVGMDSFCNMYNLSIVRNPALKNLSGSKIRSIDFGLYVNDNDALETLSGLTYAKDMALIEIHGNDKLLHFGNFPNLVPYPGQLYSDEYMRIYDNKNLIDFAEMAGGGPYHPDHIYVNDNPNLVSTFGMGSIKSIGRLTIYDNPKLKKIEDFSSLNNIVSASWPYPWWGNISIKGAAIDSIAFPALKRCDWVHISECPSLIRLVNAFPVADSCYNITITNNPNLTWVHEDAGPRTLAGLVLTHNPKLGKLSGFDSLRVTGGSVFNPYPVDSTSLEGGDGIIADGNGDQPFEVLGFNNLRIGSVYLYSYPEFRGVWGFKNLERIDGKLYINGAKVINAFPKLKTVYGNLQIYNITDSLIAFQQLDTILGKAINNYGLMSVNKVSGCYFDTEAYQRLHIGKFAWVGNGGSSSGLVRLSNLEIVDESVNTNWHENIETIHDIYPKLKEVGGIYFEGNYHLKTIDDFPAVTKVKGWPGGKRLHVTENDSLTNCIGLCRLFNNSTLANAPASSIEIQNPLAPCSDRATLEAWCDTVMTATEQPMVKEAARKRCSIHPNPAQGNAALTISADPVPDLPIDIHVFNASGQEMLTFPGVRYLPFTFETGDLPAGIYWVHVRGRKWEEVLQQVLVR